MIAVAIVRVWLFVSDVFAFVGAHDAALWAVLKAAGHVRYDQIGATQPGEEPF